MKFAEGMVGRYLRRLGLDLYRFEPIYTGAMGQYFYIVNLDKKEFLHPHKFGDGLKLWEIGCSSMGTLAGLTLLLGTSSGIDSELAGRWAGNRIAIIGDYDESPEFGGIYNKCGLDEETNQPGEYEDISYDVVRVMAAADLLRDTESEWLKGIWARDGFKLETK